jgi:hypothetical protein
MMDSVVIFFLIQALGSILLLFANDGCPTIFILGSIVGIDRTDSLGTGTVRFRVLSRWYSSTRQCASSTVALNNDLQTSTPRGHVVYQTSSYMCCEEDIVTNLVFFIFVMDVVNQAHPTIHQKNMFKTIFD